VHGTAAGNKLTSLLKAHILGAVTVLQAAKAGDQAAIAQAESTGRPTAARSPTSFTPPTPTISRSGTPAR
jgi:hypothetical protein